MNYVIVSGANGFIGSAVIKYLIKQNIHVVALYKDAYDNIPVSASVTPIKFSLNNIAALETAIPKAEYDIFYHFAWAGTSGEARTDTQLQLQNAQWTVDSVNLAYKLRCKRFVGAGSIMEHETVAAAYAQGNRPGLGYIYGGGKLIAHIMSKSIAVKLGIEFVWTEITNAYGIGEISPRLVNSTIRKCINGEAPQFTAGTQQYDFVYIDDVARAFYLIGKNGKSFHEYVIGSSNAKSLKSFLLEMKEAIAPDLTFTFGDVPFTGIDLPLSAFDCTHTENDTTFKAEISFAEGTKRTREWLETVGN